ncbi:hypothetical protein M5689_001430 [Euphorbia peplus]|nr:hypothetical protein M5689_001430 [Euphorbia peplus]
MTPNPENGEFWIPSDVYHEINNSSSYPSSPASSTFLLHAPLSPSIFPFPIPFFHPSVTGYFLDYGFYLYCHWMAAFQLMYNPFPFYFPFIPQYQVLNNIQGSEYPFKCRGTGVFIPQIGMNASNNKPKLEGKSEISHNEKGNKYICFEKKEGNKQVEESQLSQELNLPPEWVYS